MTFLLWYLPSLAVSLMILGNRFAQRREYLDEFESGVRRQGGYYTYPFGTDSYGSSLGQWTALGILICAAVSLTGARHLAVASVWMATQWRASR